MQNRKAVPIVWNGKKVMGDGVDDDSASPLFYSCSNSLSTVTTPEIAKPQSRQLKIHPNSHPTITPDQLSYFF